jgi:hypothetical protein
MVFIVIYFSSDPIERSQRPISTISGWDDQKDKMAAGEGVEAEEGDENGSQIDEHRFQEIQVLFFLFENTF